MKKVLVTGATGFTGGHLARHLVQHDSEVVAFVRPTSNVDHLKALGVDCRVVDIKDHDAVMRHFDKFDVVYHIAAAYRTEHSDRSEFIEVNVNATRHLLEAAAANNAGMFVHCSTVGVQGEIEDPPADEDYRFQPGDHYQDSKLEGERLARQYFAKGLRGCVVRPVGIYGPGDTRFLKLFKAVQSGKFVMIGNGKTLYHLTYIDDLIAGFILAGTHPAAVGEVFTIAGERYTTLNELVAELAKILDRKTPRWHIPAWPVLAAAHVCDHVCRPLGLSPPIYPRRVEFFLLDRAFSIAKAKSVLGYAPAVGLQEGLRRTADHYRSQGLLA
jgi:nucleoside-diphosphate-sugar epimerase